MGQSGTKLVILLVGLALIAGATSWWYRYESAHQATTYWGNEAARLIAQPAEVEAFDLSLLGAESALPKGAEVLDLGRKYQAGEPRTLTNARGMVHLRNALMSDRSYEWGTAVDPVEVDWRWCLRFFESSGEVRIVLSADLATLGRVVAGGVPPVKALSCRPLTESLQFYFVDLGLIDASTEQ
jgi:hypothetical protein